jgi:hypothetical protein
MKIAIVFIFALTLFTLAPMGQAQSSPTRRRSPDDNTDGKHLFTECDNAVRLLDGDEAITQKEYGEAFYCVGLVHGVDDFLDALGQITPRGDDELGLRIRMVRVYLREHPEKLSERDTTLVMMALKKAFPKK